MPGENQFYSAGATCFHLGATQCHPCKNPLYYNCLHLLSPRITIDASYIKQKTMEENQNEEEVLLVADKDDEQYFFFILIFFHCLLFYVICINRNAGRK